MNRYQKDLFKEGEYYHIYNKVVSRTKLFVTEHDYTYFLQRYVKYFAKYFDTLAYCLIPNHFHLLVKVKDKNILHLAEEKTNAAIKCVDNEVSINFFIEHQLSRMFSGYVLRYNNQYRRSGPLFKEGTKRVRLKTTQRIIHQLCYIHHNPIHHFLTKSYKGWKYSSYRDYHQNENSIINKELIFCFLENMSNFEQSHLAFKEEKHTWDL